MNISTFQKRIDYKGDLQKLFEIVASEYGLGSLKSHKVVLKGYEDFNVVIDTTKGKYFAKVFASTRKADEIKQYVEVMQLAIDSGISHPKLLRSPLGNMHKVSLDNATVDLVVMDYIDGKDFHELGEKPTMDELKFISRQAAMINKLEIKPKFVYDSWAIPNFLKEYGEVKKHLDPEDRALINPLAKKYESFKLDTLPKAFVHGDIIATNVIRDGNDKIYIFDFAVANLYPRIQELAVLLCDLFFVPNKDKFMKNYQIALDEYQKIIKLEKKEIDMLPTYIKLAHAMHIVPATREKILHKNSLPENEFWLKSGQEGLRFVTELWS